MRRMKRVSWLAVLLLVLALVAAACGSDDNNDSSAKSGDNGSSTTSASGSDTSTKPECGTGTLAGAGSTFVQGIEGQWAKDYQDACSGSTIQYQGVGSGAGIQQFIAGTVDFGASDALLKPEEETAAKAKGGDVVTIPWSAGGIALEFNVSGLDSLKLSPETIAGIFAGKITKWDDAAIKTDNSGADLPSTGIQVVHRSDDSGTTNAFTSYMAAVAPSVWTSPPAKAWPAGGVGQGAKGSDGVTSTVKQTDGAIGYAELSFAQSSGLKVASVKNAGGKFVQPDADSVSAAVAGWTVPADLKIKPDYTVSDAKAYPISTPTYVIVFAKQTDPAKGKLLKGFLKYAVTTGQSSAEDLYYAPLPKDLQDKAAAAVDSIQA